MTTVPPRIGRYEIKGKIAERNAIILLAKDPLMARDVAIKYYPPVDSKGYINEMATPEWLFRERWATARVKHPNVIELHDLVEFDNSFAFVYEYLDGESLTDHIRRRGYLPPTDVYPILSAILSALQAVHAEQIVHRDIKPDNIQVCENGVVKLFDFGIARVPGVPVKTQMDWAPGTPGYMAPEQVRQGTADPMTDIFAVGCVAYEMLFGVGPFRGQTRDEIINAVLFTEPAFPASYPKEIKLFLSTALCKDRAGRYSCVDDMRRGLEAAFSEILNLHGKNGRHDHQNVHFNINAQANPKIVLAAGAPPAFTLSSLFNDVRRYWKLLLVELLLAFLIPGLKLWLVGLNVLALLWFLLSGNPARRTSAANTALFLLPLMMMPGFRTMRSSGLPSTGTNATPSLAQAPNAPSLASTRVNQMSGDRPANRTTTTYSSSVEHPRASLQSPPAAKRDIQPLVKQHRVQQHKESSTLPKHHWVSPPKVDTDEPPPKHHWVGQPKSDSDDSPPKHHWVSGSNQSGSDDGGN